MPTTAVVTKALLPVGLRPMLHWTLLEAVSTGVEGIIIVVSPHQETVRCYVEQAKQAARSTAGDDLATLGRALEGHDVVWVEQQLPSGVGDAFSHCRQVTGTDDFAVLLPDNWFDTTLPAMAQVAATRLRTGSPTIGLIRVSPAQASLYGNVGGVHLEALDGPKGVYQIISLQDKRKGSFSVDGSRPTLRGCARYALGPEFYDALDATGPPEVGEWDDVPAFQRLIKNAGLIGQEISGTHFDVGQGAGYLAAAAYLAEVASK